MSVKELLELEIGKLEQDDLLLLYSFVQIMKRKNQKNQKRIRNFNNYLAIREILNKCDGSLSADIIQEREDRF